MAKVPQAESLRSGTGKVRDAQLATPLIGMVLSVGVNALHNESSFLSAHSIFPLACRFDRYIYFYGRFLHGDGTLMQIG
ncbi:MAG: hypothetical protein HOJ61_01535 [Gammaproteobacteria bacterium]|nr:hypothetical protein [Gammaproteobacteria bacterium]MBT5600891.1 hypothetical protein [Gammaproteobacteria bacterium]